MRVAMTFLLILTAACGGREQTPPTTAAPAPSAATPGDAAKGRQLVGQYGCNVCHSIPGIEGEGTMGPSLAGLAARPAISGGTVENTAANLAQFIQNPASLNPQSSMPPIALTPADANDIVAFLQTLK